MNYLRQVSRVGSGKVEKGAKEPIKIVLLVVTCPKATLTTSSFWAGHSEHHLVRNAFEEMPCYVHKPVTNLVSIFEITCLRLDFVTKKGADEADAKLSDPIGGQICRIDFLTCPSCPLFFATNLLLSAVSEGFWRRAACAHKKRVGESTAVLSIVIIC